jgi:hypothetical protein
MITVLIHNAIAGQVEDGRRDYIEAKRAQWKVETDISEAEV